MSSKIIFLIIALSACLLCACSLFVDRTGRRLEKVCDALEDRDTDKLRAMFSENTLALIPDFDERAECVFQLFQGKVKAYKQDGSTGSSESRDGKRRYLDKSKYFVTTDVDEYVVFMIDYPIDTMNPSNQGLFNLRVIKKADYAEFRSYGGYAGAKRFIPGLFYTPE
jgi:hypothetical protein